MINVTEICRKKARAATRQRPALVAARKPLRPVRRWQTRAAYVGGRSYSLTDSEIIELAESSHPGCADELASELDGWRDGDRLMDFDLDVWRAKNQA